MQQQRWSSPWPCRQWPWADEWRLRWSCQPRVPRAFHQCKQWRWHRRSRREQSFHRRTSKCASVYLETTLLQVFLPGFFHPLTPHTSSDSEKYSRRSEWPRMTQSIPRSLSCSGLRRRRDVRWYDRWKLKYVTIPDLASVSTAGLDVGVLGSNADFLLQGLANAVNVDSRGSDNNLCFQCIRLFFFLFFSRVSREGTCLHRRECWRRWACRPGSCKWQRSRSSSSCRQWRSCEPCWLYCCFLVRGPPEKRVENYAYMLCTYL